VAIDFRLTASQRELQLRSREFAKEVLSPAIEAESLPIPEERFAATKPAYEAMIAAGFLRKCIPLSNGGESAGLTDTAIMVEELYAVNASVALTLIGTVLGLLPLLIGGTEEQRSRLLPPILETSGGAAGGVLRHRTGGQCQCRIATAGRGRSHHSEVLGRQMDHPGPQELGFLGHGLGSQGRRPSVGTLPHRSRCSC